MKKITSISIIYLSLSIILILAEGILVFSEPYLDYGPGQFAGNLTALGLLIILAILVGFSLLIILPRGKGKKFLIIGLVINILGMIFASLLYIPA